jgi:adenylate cyclase
MNSNYSTSKSFIGKTPVILVMLGILPFLLVIYLFIYEQLTITTMVMLMSALALFSVLAGYSLMRRSADQLVRLALATKFIESGEEFKPIEIIADEEISDIARHFNSMLEKLNDANRDVKEQSVQLMIYGRDLAQSYQLAKEEERLRNRLGRYVGNTLVEKLISSKDELFMENERQEVTVLFADIRQFTSFSEKMPAEDVVAMLNEFFGAMIDIIFKNKGILDKFIGDALMAVFGIIETDRGGARNAVTAALEMQQAVDALMVERGKTGQEVFDVGIGVNTGYAIFGSVGSQDRLDYTVIGDCVNTAARLESTARGGEIIIGEETRRKILGEFDMKEKGGIRVKNKTDPVVCYEVVQKT